MKRTHSKMLRVGKPRAKLFYKSRRRRAVPRQCHLVEVGRDVRLDLAGREYTIVHMTHVNKGKDYRRGASD